MPLFGLHVGRTAYLGAADNNHTPVANQLLLPGSVTFCCKTSLIEENRIRLRQQIPDKIIVVFVIFSDLGSAHCTVKTKKKAKCCKNDDTGATRW